MTWPGGGYRVNRQLDLSTAHDRLVMTIFMISLLLCALAVVVLFHMGTVSDLIAVPPLFTASFVIVGLVSYVHVCRWQYLLGLLAASALLILLGIDILLAGFLVYAVLGIFGTVSIAVALQRRFFYPLICRIEAMGMKASPDRKDGVIAYILGIQGGVDTRGITISHEGGRKGMPIREIAHLILCGCMLGTFMLIYLSMDPVLLTGYNVDRALMMTFLISVYLPFLVLPWAAVRSLDVRIAGGFRDSRISDGAFNTLSKIVIPAILILIYAFVSVNTLDLETVVAYMLASLAFDMLVMGSAAVLYFMFFEKELVGAISSGWEVFRPSSSVAEPRSERDSRGREFPASPRRSYEDEGAIDLSPYR